MPRIIENINSAEFEQASDLLDKVRDVATCWNGSEHVGAGGPLDVIYGLAWNFLHLLRMQDSGEVVVIRRRGCGCCDMHFDEAAVTAAQRIVDEGSKEDTE